MIFEGFFRTIPISLEQGLGYALVALGIVITFRILAFPDLTVDGSFALGGAVVARLITEGVTPIYAIFLMMTILYSVNLRIMGRSNIQLLTVNTFITPLENMEIHRFIPIIIFFFVVTFMIKLLTDMFFRTQIGFAMRATGDNEQMIRTLGVNTDNMTVLGLGISNALVALSGCLVAQDQGFSDVGMGIGMIVAGLAAIIIGETIIGKTSVQRMTLAAIVGSVIYKFIIAVGLRLGLAPTDLKMATGVMVIIALGFPALKKGKEGKLHLRGV